MICPVCGARKYSYSPAFVKMWDTVMRFYPVYALPEVHTCIECIEYKLGFPVSPFYRARRKQWLQSTDPVAHLDEKDPDVYRRLKAGQKLARDFRKLLKKQKEKMLKIRTRRFMKRTMRQFKQRDKAIREVLERATELCGEEANA